MSLDKPKLQKALGPALVERLYEMDAEGLEIEIVRSQKAQREIKNAREKDEDLAAAKAHVSLCDQPYKDALKRQQQIAELASIMLEEMGGDEDEKLRKEIRQDLQRITKAAKRRAEAEEDAA